MKLNYDFIIMVNWNRAIINVNWLFCCSFQAEKVYNQDLYFKKTVKYVGEPMSHIESIASSAVHFLVSLLKILSLAQGTI
jgi:pyruvate kinase